MSHPEPASRVETGASAGQQQLLAMQKVEGSNPFSRLEKRLQIAGVSALAAG